MLGSKTTIIQPESHQEEGVHLANSQKDPNLGAADTTTSHQRGANSGAS